VRRHIRCRKPIQDSLPPRLGGLLDQEVRPRETRNVGNDFRGRQGLQNYCQRRPSEFDGIAGSARVISPPHHRPTYSSL